MTKFTTNKKKIKNKVCRCFHCFLIYLWWSNGTGCRDLSFLNVEFSISVFFGMWDSPNIPLLDDPRPPSLCLWYRKSSYNAGDLGLIPGSGRSPGEGDGSSPQYSCLENSMDNRSWWSTVHGVRNSHTWLKVLAHTHGYFWCSGKVRESLFVSTVLCYATDASEC